MSRIQRFAVAFWNALEFFYDIKRYFLMMALTYGIGVWGFIKVLQLPDDTKFTEFIYKYGSFLMNDPSNFITTLVLSLFAILLFVIHGLSTIYCSIRVHDDYETNSTTIIIIRTYGVLACLWSLAYVTLPVLTLLALLLLVLVVVVILVLR
ncbi:hypothetical protein [Brevibacillus reuszeri]|uniref:Uncharacterized protein n=1 Tax=Brevibacillus reuszeri TaxID=54915 RepID=A0A0K9YWE4_9BACL|nr:hypothetical protein [Brevibacillus reuszeri]KNB72942.1 hypothetical protein ADS79_14045 [Brevibacillus reuszeri]